MMTKKLFLILSISLTVILVSVLLISKGVLWFVYPDSNEYPVRGIDVSHHQGNIDWKLVAQDNIQFAYIKATEADDLVDNRFRYNWTEARENNITVGAYHFYSLAYSGEMQAKNFVETVPVNDTQLQPAIDLEYTGNSKKRPSKDEFQTELKKFINITTEKFGQKPILYTTYNFYEDYLYPEFSDYPIWIRDIFSKPNTKVISNWHIWQYNPYGKVEGIDGSVDLNVLKQTEL